jgi:integrase
LVHPNTAKHGSARVLKLKSQTLNLLASYLAKHSDMKLNDKLLGNWSSDDYGKWFRHYRNKLANKLSDASIRTITLYSLRHGYATRLYHRTRDILLVKQQLGHRKIETTLIYTQLVNSDQDSEYSSATARTIDEAKALIEQGFEYVTEIDGIKLFRKRK